MSLGLQAAFHHPGFSRGSVPEFCPFQGTKVGFVALRRLEIAFTPFFLPNGLWWHGEAVLPLAATILFVDSAAAAL